MKCLFTRNSKNSLRIFLTVGMLLEASCTPKTHKTGADSTTNEMDASLSMLFAPDGDLAGAPNLFSLDVEIAREDGSTQKLRRQGNLPPEGQVISVTNLPVADQAKLTMGLFKDQVNESNQTHHCEADSSLKLVGGETASVSLTCFPLAKGIFLEKVKVFLKVAKVDVSFDQHAAQELLGKRDWTQPAQFAQVDEQCRRISLRSTAAGLLVHVGGDLTLLAAGEAGASLMPKLLAGETITLLPTHGTAIDSITEPVSLALDGAPVLYEDGDALKAVLSIVMHSSQLDITGHLLEEAPQSEFTVMDYNVENFFDQVDDDRNKSYGDYRIASNDLGQSSNFGEPLEFAGRMVSFTDVKIAGIRKAMLGIDPNGPAIVAMEEVESQTSMNMLLEATKDLGYVDGRFSVWSAAAPTAIGVGLLTKFPVLDFSMIEVPLPDTAAPDAEPLRGIMKVKLDVLGKPLVVYINHWKSKSGKESLRMASAKALQDDIDSLTHADAKADYIIMGDLNSDYNEATILKAEHNDTNGLTGLNSILKAQGDELAVLKGKKGLKYNLNYELDRSLRHSAWYPATSWCNLDHIIISSGLYDNKGITYVDNSYQIARPVMPRLNFLFNADGIPLRWQQVRVSDKVTRHEIGGFSDHLPVFARFQIARRQSGSSIALPNPSVPDASDKPQAN